MQPPPPRFKVFICLTFPGGYYHRCVLPYPANFCIFIVEMRFHHVGWAGLELLTSGDLLTSASQSAGIIGVSHYIQPGCFDSVFQHYSDMDICRK